MTLTRKVYCKSCCREVQVSYEYNRCPFCWIPLDLNKEDFSYEIKRYSSFSFRYEYTLEGRHKYIFASSEEELMDNVLDRGFPWEDEVDSKDKEIIKIGRRRRYYDDSKIRDYDYVEYELPIDDMDLDDRGWH